MTGEKFTLMQYSVNAILGLIEAEQFVIPEIQRAIVNEKNIFSFTISRYARSDRRERMCKAILIKFIYAFTIIFIGYLT